MKLHTDIAGVICLFTEPGRAVFTDDREGDIELSLEDLGTIAEWLATAWGNLAGEEYKPVAISERGYVSDFGVPTGGYIVPKSQIKLSAPSIDMLRGALSMRLNIVDDGNGLTSNLNALNAYAANPGRIERDCE